MSEYCLRSETKSWSQLHIYRSSNWLQLPTRAQFWCSLGSILSVVTLNLLSEGCIHDKPLNWIVSNHQRLSSWNTVHSPQHSQILHPFKIYSLCFLVKAFRFVLHIVAIEDSGVMGCHSPKELLSWSHWARVRNLIVPSPHQVAPICREGFHILHAFPRLLRKDWADLQKQLCDK